MKMRTKVEMSEVIWLPTLVVSEKEHYAFLLSVSDEADFSESIHISFCVPTTEYKGPFHLMIPKKYLWYYAVKYGEKDERLKWLQCWNCNFFVPSIEDLNGRLHIILTKESLECCRAEIVKWQMKRDVKDIVLAVKHAIDGVMEEVNSNE